jgi:hypothetical protein
LGIVKDDKHNDTVPPLLKQKATDDSKVAASKVDKAKDAKAPPALQMEPVKDDKVVTDSKSTVDVLNKGA